jgi:hypothetical protein
MIPSKTHEVIGEGQVIAACRRFDLHQGYALRGIDLIDLDCLVRRLGIGPPIGGDEMRDWQNRLALMVNSASQLDGLP